MGPITFTTDMWPPVDPADRPARGELALNGEKDRRANRLAHQRRRHQEETNPDADEFTHQQATAAEDENTDDGQ